MEENTITANYARALQTAIHNKDVKEVKNLISKQELSLFELAKAGKFKEIRWLVTNVLDNLEDSNSRSCCRQLVVGVVKNQHLDIVKWLVNHFSERNLFLSMVIGVFSHHVNNQTKELGKWIINEFNPTLHANCPCMHSFIETVKSS